MNKACASEENSKSHIGLSKKMSESRLYYISHVVDMNNAIM